MRMRLSKKARAYTAGALAGLVNGFFGTGGGMVLVPLFSHWLKLPQKKALATSVASIAPLCALSACIYFLRGALDLSAALPFLLGGLAGGVLGGLCFKNVSPVFLRRAFGLLLVYGGVRAFLPF